MTDTEPKTIRSFWSFLVRGLVTDGASALVRGWFVVLRQQSLSPEERALSKYDQYLTLEFLTPQDRPVELDVTTLVAAGTKLDDLSPRTVVAAATALFSLPFMPIPPAPSSLPLHRMPPSQREKMKALIDATNHSAFNHPYAQRAKL